MITGEGAVKWIGEEFKRQNLGSIEKRGIKPF